MMKTAQEFYDYFHLIPEEEWKQGSMTYRKNGKTCHCAMGHLGAIDFGYDNDPEYIKEGFKQEEVVENITNLGAIFCEVENCELSKAELVIYRVNDKTGNPKENILNKLIEKGAEP